MTRKLILFILFAFVIDKPVSAQSDTASSIAPRYRISLLTCNPGMEEWETFGHACIRVIDSNQEGAERDKIYNYGFFEASEDNTLWQQALNSRVMSFLDTITFAELMVEYNDKQRGIIEQEFLMAPADKEKLVRYLRNNLKRQNRYCEFDTFYGNCSTHIRQLFENVFGKNFVAGRPLPADSKLTFRNVATWVWEHQHKYWFGLGINLFYASRLDKKMTNDEAMYLPVILRKSFQSATLYGKPLCGAPAVIHSDGISWPDPLNWPLLITVLTAVTTIGLLLVPDYRLPATIITAMVLVTTGVLGCLMLRQWLLDGEPGWKDNYNILWALPTNIVLPFLSARIKAGYSVVAICLLGVSLVLHAARVQELPMPTIGPWLLSLLFIYGIMYRKYQVRSAQLS